MFNFQFHENFVIYLSETEVEIRNYGFVGIAVIYHWRKKIWFEKYEHLCSKSKIK